MRIYPNDDGPGMASTGFRKPKRTTLDKGSIPFRSSKAWKGWYYMPTAWSAVASAAIFAEALWRIAGRIAESGSVVVGLLLIWAIVEVPLLVIAHRKLWR